MRHLGNELYHNITVAGSHSIKGGERYDSHSLNISGLIKREQTLQQPTSENYKADSIDRQMHELRNNSHTNQVINSNIKTIVHKPLGREDGHMMHVTPPALPSENRQELKNISGKYSQLNRRMQNVVASTGK